MHTAILPLLAVLSMASAAMAAEPVDDTAITRCAQIRLNQSAPENIGYAMKRIKLREIDIGERPVIIQSAMAGLRGPRLTMLGRDVRLAVTKHQVSPQELWHRANWNKEEVHTKCQAWPKRPWAKSLKYGFYPKGVLENTVGMTSAEPTFMLRSRALVEALLVRPYGFTFGAAAAVTIKSNTGELLYLDDGRDPVRRDISLFSQGMGLERLYASWRTTPVSDLHIALTGGFVEEMYGGAEIEAVYRPFSSPVWFGADAWQLWRRDPRESLNAKMTDEDVFTGHVRAGYDIPDTRAGVAVAAGRYLGGDKGVTLQFTQAMFESMRIEAGLTWTDRQEDHGFISNTHFEPTLRATWNLGGSKHYENRMSLRQIGRDGGQMIDRPLPLEKMTEIFSVREMARAWPAMFE